MIHARSENEARALCDGIINETGLHDHELLPTTEEYKKTRIRYFSEEHYTWKGG
jgi:hypothetical protein